MQIRKNDGGFTLVELVVGMLISSLILVFATGMILSANNFFMDNITRSENKQIGDTVFNYLKEELTFGTDVQLFGASSDASGEAVGSRSLTVTGGRLYSMGQDVYGEDFYMGRSVKFTASVHIFCELNLSVTVFDKDGSEVYTTASTINVLNMKLAQKEIEVFSGVSDNPYITYDRQGDGKE